MRIISRVTRSVCFSILLTSLFFLLTRAGMAQTDLATLWGPWEQHLVYPFSGGNPDPRDRTLVEARIVPSNLLGSLLSQPSFAPNQINAYQGEQIHVSLSPQERYLLVEAEPFDPHRVVSIVTGTTYTGSFYRFGDPINASSIVTTKPPIQVLPETKAGIIPSDDYWARWYFCPGFALGGNYFAWTGQIIILPTVKNVQTHVLLPMSPTFVLRVPVEVKDGAKRLAANPKFRFRAPRVYNDGHPKLKDVTPERFTSIDGVPIWTIRAECSKEERFVPFGGAEVFGDPVKTTGTNALELKFAYRIFLLYRRPDTGS